MEDKLEVKERYGIAPNELLNNPDISASAKGLFVYMQSKPPGWKYSQKGIASQMKDSVLKIQKAIKELKDFGYLEIIPVQEKGGMFKGYRWVLNAYPAPRATLTELAKNRNSDNRNSVKRQYISKKELSKKEEEIEDRNGSISISPKTNKSTLLYGNETLTKDKVDNKTYDIDYLRNLSNSPDPQDTEPLATQFNISHEAVKKVANDILNYIEMHDKPYKNYLATMRSWIARQIREKQIQPREELTEVDLTKYKSLTD
jgi:hypothetical protein